MAAIQDRLGLWTRKGTDIASAATILVPTTGDRFDVTGTTGISTIQTNGRGIGARFVVYFVGAVILTHSANLSLAGTTSRNITAGTYVEFEVLAVNQVREVPRSSTNSTGAASSTGASTALAFIDVTGSSAASINLNAIDQTYKSLMLMVQGHDIGTTSVFSNLILRLNGDAASNYVWRQNVTDSGTAGTASSLSDTGMVMGDVATDSTYNATTGSAPASPTFSNQQIFLPNYNLTDRYKTVASQSACIGTAGQRVGNYGGTWKNMAAITSLSLSLGINAFKVGSHVALYGLKES